MFLLNVRVGETQTLTFHFESHAKKSCLLTLKKGIVRDTVARGTTDEKGQATFVLPARYSSHTGMATLEISNGILIDFIVSGKENPVIRGRDSIVRGGLLTFEDSPENTALQQWFATFVLQQQKTEMLGNIAPLYHQDTPFAPAIEAERKRLLEEQHSFAATLGQSPLYAARFMEYHILSHEIARLPFATSAQKEHVRQYVRDTLDIDRLYFSGAWFEILNGLISLYEVGDSFHREYFADMSRLLDRAKSDEIHLTLAENLFAICESMGWNDMEEQLATYLMNDPRIKAPTNQLKKLFALFKLHSGRPAPALSGGAFPEGNTLLIFYESGCGHCEEELYQLKHNYTLLKEHGYEIVSVSADTDINIFRNNAALFPWTAKYCDLKGFAGDDFQNYGIMATPTIYLVDSTGTVRGRYSKYDDVVKAVIK
jgi:hypothetical protein